MTVTKTVASDFGFGGDGRAGSGAGALSGWKLIKFSLNPKTSAVRAFADIRTPAGFIFFGLLVCAKDGRQWVGFPGAPMIADDGRVILRDADDRPCYKRLTGFATAEASKRFTAAVFALVRQVHPELGWLEIVEQPA
jgi:hypothetical protein